MFPAVNVKPRSEETRARLLEAADALFRRLGFAKTTVADIASELGMSPANVYRFFPSKNAIVQALCQRCLGELEAKIWAIARGREPASERLTRLVREVLAYHKENLLVEARVSDLVQFAMQESWGAIMAHKEVHRTVIELILRDGIEAGDFEPVDPKETSKIIQRALVGYCHPLLLEQGLQEGHDLESESQAVLRLLLRGISQRR
ncbi:MAG: TetR/AcrR family transcriptional regulator [Xanthobacteraceae bacterium]|nr:TetR/AcrR family transcriptional regulator [Xanthobacteraceae bacterium]